MTARPTMVRLLAALVSVAVLGACGLPASSDVQPGRRVGDNVAPRARVVVNPPAPGAPPEVIARDFIRAGAAFQEVDEKQQVVGRAFLAPGSVDRWRPTALPTWVYDTRTQMTIARLRGNQVRLTVAVVATIDESGRYSELAPGTLRSLDLGMTQVEGQWRIQLPEAGFGLWLNTDDFDQVLAPYRVHYILSNQRRLVADVRWFPTGPRVATALARAQLGAVPSYLNGVVDSGVPEGTRLAVDAVNVDALGVATVTLTNSAETIDPARRRAIWAQFFATLTQAPGVSSISVEVQGIGRIPVSNVPNTVTSLGDLGYSTDAPPAPTTGLKRANDVLERVTPAELDEGSPAPPTAKPTKAADGLPQISTGYVDLALSADGGDIAAVAASRAELVRWRGTARIPEAAFGESLTNPSYAVDGRLWIAGTAQAHTRVWTFDAVAPQPGPPTVVRADWLEGRRVVNLAVSPDGTRAAVLSRLPNDTDFRMDVTGVVRASNGQATTLAAPYRQGEPLTRFVDVTWLDSMSLVVLAQDKQEDPLRPFKVDLGQGVGLRRVGQLDLDQTLIKEVPGATSITSRGGVRGLVVMTDNGILLRAGNAWAAQPAVSEIVIGGT